MIKTELNPSKTPKEVEDETPATPGYQPTSSHTSPPALPTAESEKRFTLPRLEPKATPVDRSLRDEGIKGWGRFPW